MYEPFTTSPTPSSVSTIQHDPYAHHFMAYSSSEAADPMFADAHTYTHPRGGGPSVSHPFSSIHRIKIIDRLLKLPIKDGGCGFVYDAMIANESINAVFPLEDIGAKKILAETWTNARPWATPIEEIRL